MGGTHFRGAEGTAKALVAQKKTVDFMEEVHQARARAREVEETNQDWIALLTSQSTEHTHAAAEESAE